MRALRIPQRTANQIGRCCFRGNICLPCTRATVVCRSGWGQCTRHQSRDKPQSAGGRGL